jgi:hypothetical protein
MNMVIVTYGIFFAISLGMTIWVAKPLHRNGRLFLIDAFHGNEERADAVNHLLVVGFYLLNIGFVLLYLKMGRNPTNSVQAVEYAATKLGVVMLVLGGMHFFNMYNFDKMRRKGTAGSRTLAGAIESRDG